MIKFSYFYKYIITFIILTFIIILSLNNEKNSKIEQHLKNKSTQLNIEYKAIYNYHKNLSEILYKIIINKKDIINIFKDARIAQDPQKIIIRNKLHNRLKSTYSTLIKYKIKQLHFHLPNNESFIRFHRPAKYGDDLTKFRETIAYVNKNKKRIDGFEEGKVFNGYRFAYPLFDNNIHIGSVEVSFSSLAMTDKIKENYSLDSSFLMSKDIVDFKLFESEKSNYEKSNFKDFYVEKSFHHKHYDLAKKSQIKINDKIKEGILFSTYEKKINKILTFIPIENPVTHKVVGSIAIFSDAAYIKNKIYNFYFISAVIILFILLLIIFLYKRIEFKKIILEKNSQLEELNNSLNIEVQKQIEQIRSQDKLIFKQSKLSSLNELIINISHQWRQPLSIISTIATTIQMQKEYEILDDTKLDKSLEDILNSTQSISRTIDRFSEFSLSLTKKEDTDIRENILNAVHLCDGIIKDNKITIVLKIQEDIKIETYPTELISSIINIITNSKDALILNNIKDKYIFISTSTSDNKLKITIKDNANGIDKDIIDRIFEPYFTTKHQSQGTGLGLYMVHRIIVEEMLGEIIVKNEKYKHNEIEYEGTSVSIILLIK